MVLAYMWSTGKSKIYMVYRKIEEALDLVGVQVGGDDPVAAGGYKEVGH